MTRPIIQVVILVLLQLAWLQSVRANYSMTLNGITWDDSCTRQDNPEHTSEKKQATVKRAWGGALELIDNAWKRFEKTRSIVAKTHLTEGQQKTINENDPAYALFFAFESSRPGREKINGTLANLKLGANADMGTDPRPNENKGRIHISCQDKVHDHGEDACERGPVFTESDESSSVSYMNFCPTFWQKPRFDQLKTADSEEVYTWYHDPGFKGTDAKSIFHELTHLWYIANTNADVREKYGVEDCAELAWDCDPKPNNKELLENADSYALYGEYGYFVSKGYSEMWDPSEEDVYPVRIPVRSW